MTLTTIFSYAWAAAALVMLVMWAVQVGTSNAGIVDVTWAILTPIIGTWLILADSVENGIRQYLIVCLTMVWGVRLGMYLFKRVSNETEDGRYRYMREYCGKYAQPSMFVFFQFQATWTLLFALPFWAAARNPGAGLGWLDYIGVAILIIAVFGEWLSDRQLAQFKMQKQDRSLVCNVGLWKYSRHPNYFFEWLHWWAYVCLGYGSDYWLLTWTGVVVMYVFITRVTGVPYVEQQSLRSKGDAYRKYQQTTSKFFLLPPRKSQASQLKTSSDHD
jgi:steroid 5-alpha reductase family enzyme